MPHYSLVQYTKLPDWLVASLCLVAGGLQAYSFAPEPNAILQIATLAVLAFFLLQSRSLKQACLLGGAFGLAYFLHGIYWVYISLHTYGQMASPWAALAVLFLSLVLASYYVLASGLSFYLARKNHCLSQGYYGLWTFLFASSWLLAEWLRGTLFTGFPWLNIGYAHSDGALAGLAPILGVYGIAGIAAWLAASLAVSVHLLFICIHAATGHQSQRVSAQFAHVTDVRGVIAELRTNQGHRYLKKLGAILLSIGIVMVLSDISKKIHWTTPHGKPINIRLIQSNIGLDTKFDPGSLDQVILQQALLLDSPAPLIPPDAFIFPETTVPVFQDDLPLSFWQDWIDETRNRNASIILGVATHRYSSDNLAQANYATQSPALNHQFFNSVLAIDKAADANDIYFAKYTARYDKHHLVPFGEFIPWGFRWFVDLMVMPLGDFDRGSSKQSPFIIKDQKIAANICYEDLFGEELRQAVKGDDGANILVNLSNLGWFGDSKALPQHLQISRMRSLETGRPMLRATNTGVTAYILPNGQVHAQLPLNQRGVLDITVQGTLGLTPYIFWGNYFVLIVVFLIISLHCLVWKEN